jgi:hypothetical protein
MSTMVESLPSKSLTRKLCTQLIIKVASKSNGPDIECFEDSDVFFEHDYLENDNGTDSDDEAEEENRNDDMIKMIEGLW